MLQLGHLHASSAWKYLLQGVAEHEMAKNGRAQDASTIRSPSTHETRLCASKASRLGALTRVDVVRPCPHPRGRADPPASPRCRLRRAAPQGRTAPWARASTSPLPAPVDERCAPVRTSPPTPARTPSPTSTMHFCHPRIRVVHIRTRRDVGAARSGARTTTTTTGHTVDNVYPSAELIPGPTGPGGGGQPET